MATPMLTSRRCDPGPSPSGPLPYRSVLPRLRIGSELTTRKGMVFRIIEPLVLVAESGAESHSVIVDRTAGQKRAVLVLTVGMLANLTRGATHKPGAGPLIDWSEVARRRQVDVKRTGVHQPTLVRRGPTPAA